MPSLSIHFNGERIKVSADSNLEVLKNIFSQPDENAVPISNMFSTSHCIGFYKDDLFKCLKKNDAVTITNQSNYKLDSIKPSILVVRTDDADDCFDWLLKQIKNSNAEAESGGYHQAQQLDDNTIKLVADVSISQPELRKPIAVDRVEYGNVGKEYSPVTESFIPSASPVFVEIVDVSTEAGLKISLVDSSDEKKLYIENQGTWVVSDDVGMIAFHPVRFFVSNPDPIKYTITNNMGLTSNQATITVLYLNEGTPP